MSETQQRFQILSLSGGGYLGLYTISVLAELEAMVGSPIARHFDLIAGTSVGGIIAAGLAAEVPAVEIKKAFEDNGSRIFSDRPAPMTDFSKYLDLLKSANKPKYDGVSLRDTIERIVGKEAKLGDLKHRVLIPAVNLSKGRPQAFKTPHCQQFKRDKHLRVVDVLCATSAAPTYFPLAEIGDALFADGGLYANSPDLMALHEAEHFLCVPTANVYVLSIGTTTSEFSLSHVSGTEFGAIQWLSGQRLIRTILASQQLSVDYMIRHRLEDRYIRLDRAQSPEQERHLALDVATKDAQRTIRALAEATIQDAAGQPALAAMLNNVAPKPVFY